MADETYSWQGRSGRMYTYYVHPIGTTFKNVAGNYIYAKRNGFGGWTAQYIGQTDDLGSRLAYHPKEPCAKRNGATHIHAHANSDGELARKAEESDLIARHSPPCNQMP